MNLRIIVQYNDGVIPWWLCEETPIRMWKKDVIVSVKMSILQINCLSLHLKCHERQFCCRNSDYTEFNQLFYVFISLIIIMIWKHGSGGGVLILIPR